MVSHCLRAKHTGAFTVTPGIGTACRSLQTLRKVWPRQCTISFLPAKDKETCESQSTAANQYSIQRYRSCAAGLAAAALVLFHPQTAAAQDLQAQPQQHHCSSPSSPAAASARTPSQAVNPLASVAGLFGFQSAEDDGDTAGPFSVQGQTRKKYIIERKDGEKVVARKQGITTSTCLTARPLIGDQSSSAPSQTCKQAEEKTVEQACASSCQEACKSSISEFTEAREKFSGFVSQPGERDKITRACTRRCVYECKKPADGYIFEVNTRR